MSESGPAICDLCYYVRGKTPHARDCPRRPENAGKDAFRADLLEATKYELRLANERDRLAAFVAKIAGMDATGGDPWAECSLCRGELQREARSLLEPAAVPGDSGGSR